MNYIERQWFSIKLNNPYIISPLLFTALITFQPLPKQSINNISLLIKAVNSSLIIYPKQSINIWFNYIVNNYGLIKQMIINSTSLTNYLKTSPQQSYKIFNDSSSHFPIPFYNSRKLFYKILKHCYKMVSVPSIYLPSRPMKVYNKYYNTPFKYIHPKLLIPMITMVYIIVAPYLIIKEGCSSWYQCLSFEIINLWDWKEDEMC